MYTRVPGIARYSKNGERKGKVGPSASACQLLALPAVMLRIDCHHAERALLALLKPAVNAVLVKIVIAWQTAAQLSVLVVPKANSTCLLILTLTGHPEGEGR
mmetsp:Transcript_65074/g.107950  ORF Transcript_65074/g.107950 Transcript_65074/m.107950 type:complete len:102 (-) Transcript_65074:771-1076(-)